jgi:ABC-2 type transport system ATP-binding protein
VTPAIEIRDLHKRYGTRAAVDGIDLDVEPGSVHGFLGPNGAGKTTTMRVLMGLLRADAGTARLLGADPWRDGLAVRARVGYLPSAPGLYGRMTGRRLLDHFSRLDGRPPVLRDHACAALALSADDLARPVRSYSRGMRQKVGVVQALQHDPELVVMDEPTEGLDPLVQDGFFSLLDGRRAAGRTVLFSSHVLSEVEALCDRVSIIRSGRIVGDGTIAALRGARPRRVTITLADAAAPTPTPTIAGATIIERQGARVVLDHRGPIDALLTALAALGAADVAIGEASLDDVFREFYAEDA